MMNVPVSEVFPGVAMRELKLPFARQPVRMLVVKDPLSLASDDLPDVEVYWAELWPAAIALSEALLDGCVPLNAQAGPVLELGCGAGLVTVAAALAGGPGCRVIAADCEPRALALTAANARHNGVAERVETVLLDWRSPYVQRHPLLLIADCLYTPDAPWEVTSFLDQALEQTPQALAVVADPDRWSAREFLQVAQRGGFRTRVERRCVPWMSTAAASELLPASGPPSDAEMREGMPFEVNLYYLTRRA